MIREFDRSLIAAAAFVGIVGSGVGAAIQWESFESLQDWVILTPVASFLWGAAVRQIWAPVLPGAMFAAVLLFAPSEAMSLFGLGVLINAVAAMAGVLTTTSWDDTRFVKFFFIAAWTIGLFASGSLIESETGGWGTPAPRADAGGFALLWLGTLGAAVIGFRTRNPYWALVSTASILFPFLMKDVDLLSEINGLVMLICAAGVSLVLVTAALFGWYHAKRSTPIPTVMKRVASVAAAVVLVGFGATGVVSAANHQFRACLLGIEADSEDFGEPWQFDPDRDMGPRNWERGEGCTERYPLPERLIYRRHVV